MYMMYASVCVHMILMDLTNENENVQIKGKKKNNGSKLTMIWWNICWWCWFVCSAFSLSIGQFFSTISIWTYLNSFVNVFVFVLWLCANVFIWTSWKADMVEVPFLFCSWLVCYYFILFVWTFIEWHTLHCKEKKNMSSDLIGSFTYQSYTVHIFGWII